MNSPGKYSLTVATVMLLSACASFHTAPSYHAVVDAGSSGSRIHLYQATPSQQGIEVHDLMQLEPAGLAGLSSYQGRAEEAGKQGMEPLLQTLNDWLAERQVARAAVPVDVLATAGMRLLEQKDAPAAQAIYRNVRQAIAAHGYQPGEIRAISGAEEGLYAWADVNYLLRNFQRGRNTAGIVEVGGASMQVAYETSEPDHPRALAASINGMRYSVLSVSYLGLGQNEARKAMLSASGGSPHPCYPNNDSGSAPASFDPGSDASAVLSGDYRYGHCNALYQTVLAAFRIRDSAVAAGFDTTRFIGISSIRRALDNWSVADRPAMLAQEVQRQCSGVDAWSLRVKPALGGASGFAQNACANGTFVHALLFDRINGLGLPGERLAGAGRINGLPPSWTRGYMLMRQTGETASPPARRQ